MKRFCSISIAFGLLLVPLSLLAEEGKVTFAPIDSGVRAEILAAIDAGSVVDIAPSVVASDEAAKDVWRGNVPGLITSINEVELFFTSLDKSENGSDFRIKAEFGSDQFVLKSSRSGLYNPEGGVVLRGGETKMVPLKTLPDPRARMVLAAPKIRPAGNFAALLCPRLVEDSVDPLSGESRTALGDAKLSLTGVRVDKIIGEVSARVLSGRGPGRISAALLTSRNIPRGSEFQDQVFSQDPAVGVRYLPLAPIDVAPFPVTIAEGEPSVEGIRARLEMQMPSGFQWIQQNDRIVMIDRIDMKAPVTVGKGIANEAFPCFLLMNIELQSSNFSKGEMVLPERLRTGEGSANP